MIDFDPSDKAGGTMVTTAKQKLIFRIGFFAGLLSMISLMACQNENTPKKKTAAAKSAATTNDDAKTAAPAEATKSVQESKPKAAEDISIDSPTASANTTGTTMSTSDAEKACAAQKRYYDPVREECSTLYTLLDIPCTRDYVLGASNTLISQADKDAYKARLDKDIVGYTLKYCMDDAANKEYRFAAWKDSATELSVDYYIVSHK